MLLKLVVFSVLSAFILAEKVRYDNYALYKIHPEDEGGLAFLKDLYEESNEFDFWKPPSKIGEYVSVVSPPEIRKDFEHSLKKRSIYWDLMQDNIQEAFDAQVNSRRKRDASRQLFWTNYQTLEEINDWFDYLVETYPDVVTLISSGQSFEGKNITGVRISRRSGRRVFLLEGGQIGADWLSPTVLTYFIDQLVRSDNAEARAASEDYDWHIFPIMNPDGFQFSQDSIRLWIKNRRPINANDTGVDLSRNWNSQWGTMHASFNPADSNFVGLGPFSELETRSFARYIESIASNMAALLSFRSFGQRLLIPFAHSTEPMFNYQDVVTIGRRAMGSLAVRYNTQYIVGTSTAVHDGTTGVLADWVKRRFNPPIVATYHLRDTGAWGYTLPVVQIQPTCEETFDSLLAIIREARFVNVL